MRIGEISLLRSVRPAFGEEILLCAIHRWWGLVSAREQSLQPSPPPLAEKDRPAPVEAGRDFALLVNVIARRQMKCRRRRTRVRSAQTASGSMSILLSPGWISLSSGESGSCPPKHWAPKRQQEIRSNPHSGGEGCQIKRRRPFLIRPRAISFNRVHSLRSASRFPRALTRAWQPGRTPRSNPLVELTLHAPGPLHLHSRIWCAHAPCAGRCAHSPSYSCAFWHPSPCGNPRTTPAYGYADLWDAARALWCPRLLSTMPAAALMTAPIGR